MRRERRTLLPATVALALLLAALSVTTATAVAARASVTCPGNATLSISPESGPSHTVVQVVGRNWHLDPGEPRTSLSVAYNNGTDVVGGVSVDDAGNWSTSIVSTKQFTSDNHSDVTARWNSCTVTKTFRYVDIPGSPGQSAPSSSRPPPPDPRCDRRSGPGGLIPSGC